MEQPSHQDWFLRKHGDGGIFQPAVVRTTRAVGQSTAHKSRRTTRFQRINALDQGTHVATQLQDGLAGPRLPARTLLRPDHARLDSRNPIRLGEINEETVVINTCDGTRRQIQEMPALLEMARAEVATDMIENESLPAERSPRPLGISIRLQERIRDLEQTLREERVAHSWKRSNATRNWNKNTSN